jgi:hypothetical protein
MGSCLGGITLLLIISRPSLGVHLAFCTECPASMCHYFRILFLMAFPYEILIKDLILNDYRAVAIWKSRWFEPYVEHAIPVSRSSQNSMRCYLSSVYSAFTCLIFHVTPSHIKSSGVKSGGHGGQLCGTTRPIHRLENCSFRYSVTSLLKCGVTRHARGTYVVMFMSVHIILISI